MYFQVHSGDWVFRFGVVGWVVLVSFELFACIYLLCICGLDLLHTIDVCLQSCSSRPVHTIAPSTIDGVARKCGLKAKDVKVVIVNHLDFTVESEQKNKKKYRAAVST